MLLLKQVLPEKTELNFYRLIYKYPALRMV